MKQIYKIDEDGYLQFGQEKLIEVTEEVPIGYTDIQLPRDGQGFQLPFYRPKLINGAWIEDMTQEEIDELNNQPKELTENEMIMLALTELAEIVLGGMG